MLVVVASGRTKVNVTEAPDAGAEPRSTVAVIDTVELVGYVDFGTDRVADKTGCGGITVRLAVAVPVLPELWAAASTAYVAAAVPAGTDLVMTDDADADGEIVRMLEEKPLDHPPGSAELRSKFRGEHPAVSLFVTDTV